MNKYGLIGSNVKYSYSKGIHEILYKHFNLNSSYDLISLEKSELETYVNKLRCNEYSGYNVTVPYKTEILKYVDVMSDSVKELGACNTLKVIDGKVCADNTDVYGFEMLLNNFNIKLNDSYILGSGGSSKSVQYILNKLNVNYIVISRNTEFDYKYLENNISNHAIINTTPIGMYPNINKSVLNKEIASKASLIIDLIYNPSTTLLMSYNTEHYNGLVMLVYQAIKSFEIWFELEVDNELVSSILKEIR